MRVEFESYEAAMDAVANTIYGNELKSGIRYALNANHNLVAEANAKAYNLDKEIEELERKG